MNRPLGDVIKEAEVIVRGKPEQNYSDWDRTGRKSIYTYTPFIVSEVLKGDLKESRIILRQPGGSKDGMELSVPGTAHFKVDEDIVVLLGNKNDDDGSYEVPGFTTGKYNVVQDERGNAFLINSMGGAAVYDPDRDPGTLSYNSKIPLEVFKKIAKGHSVPEATQKQFSGSTKTAPKDSYEAEHSHLPKVNSSPSRVAPPPQIAPESIVESKSEQDAVKKSWVPLSFALLALLGGYLLWRRR